MAIGRGQPDGSREKVCTKISSLAERRGVLLSIVVSGANRHDSVMPDPLLADRFVPSEPSLKFRANLCLDAGYVGHQTVVEAFHSFTSRQE